MQAESSKFASVLFEQGFQIWVGWNWSECHLTVFCIDPIVPDFVVYYVNRNSNLLNTGNTNNSICIGSTFFFIPLAFWQTVIRKYTMVSPEVFSLTNFTFRILKLHEFLNQSEWLFLVVFVVSSIYYYSLWVNQKSLWFWIVNLKFVKLCNE